MSNWPMVSRPAESLIHRRSGESYCKNALFGVQIIWPLPAVVAGLRPNELGIAGKSRRTITPDCRGSTVLRG